MKAKRIIAFLIVAVMLCTVLASCGNKEERKATVTFVVTVDENGEKLDEPVTIGSTEVKVEHTDRNPASVLRAAEQALLYLDFSGGYALTSDNHSIYRIDVYTEHQEDDDDTGYYTYWAAYVNGDRTTSGRQSEVIFKDGDQIELRYITGSNPHENQNYDADTGE